MDKAAPRGWHTVTPRIVVEDAAGLIAFLEQVFEAKGKFNENAPSQIRIGDSFVMVSEVGAREIFPSFLYVYIENVDAVFQRAMDAEAESIEAVWDTPYGDRRGMLRDRWGNISQVASRLS